jgi:hypothetical protein
MKKFIIGALILLLLCSAVVVNAEEILDSEFTDTAGTSTQDSVMGIENSEGFHIGTLEPDAGSQDTLDELYDFVRKEDNPPARFFDEATREKIRQMTGGKVYLDALHLTEFMSVSIKKTTATDSGLIAEMLLDVDYQPGQLVIMVFGFMDEENKLIWLPVEAEVVSLGKLHFEISSEDAKAFTQERQLMLVLTDRVGKRGGIVLEEEDHEQVGIPSIGIEDKTVIRRIYLPGDPDKVADFNISLVPLTQEMQEEIDRLQEYSEKNEDQLLGFFEQNVQDEVKLLLRNQSTDNLIVYEAVALDQEDYKDTEGDVAVLIEFATPYRLTQAVVALVGIPADEIPAKPSVAESTTKPSVTESTAKPSVGESTADDETFEWTALRTEVKEDGLDITFKQLLLSRMREKDIPILLLILSEPAVEPQSEP